MRNRTQFLFFLPLVFTLLAMPFSALAAGDIVIQAVGSVQGLIQGEAVVPGHLNWIDVFSFSHGVSTPIGPNGLPTGPPQTSLLSIMGRFDRSTVKLFTAHSTQETFSNFRMEWVQAGTAQTLIRYELVNARLIDAQESGSAGGDVTPTVSMSFSYSRINITDVVLGTTVSYDWNSVATATPEPLAKGILLPPAPNPTRGETEFRFSLPTGSNAELTLFDLRGRVVRELHRGWTSAEPVVAVWDGTDDQGIKVAQGLYVARLTYPGTVVTQRIALVR
jgi:type VI secretion system Hcp family effector